MPDDPEKTPEKPSFELKERFVWKWHPHGWLVGFLIVVLILLFRAFAR
ncbi:MAG: hypothetical protein P1U85_11655 [Verrucomicrobiales bacterium]|nr:hypothetical protein [Verrucomicrobiales bacterium]